MTDPDQIAEQEWRWQSYLWLSDTGEEMLENLLGLRNQAELHSREYAETTKRALDIQLGTVDIPQTRDWPELRAIHTHLFGNIYRWAGRPRTVRMWKGDQEFLQPQDMVPILSRVFDRAKNADWANMERTTFVAASTGMFMDLNWAHPFREGNGRSTKLFLDRVTSTARWRLDFSRISPEDWELACSTGTPMDYQPPTDLDRLLRAFSTITVEREPVSAPTPLPTEPTGLHRDGTRAIIPSTPNSAPGGGVVIGSAIHAAGLTTNAHRNPTTHEHSAIPLPAPPGTTNAIEPGL